MILHSRVANARFSLDRNGNRHHGKIAGARESAGFYNSVDAAQGLSHDEAAQNLERTEVVDSR